MPNGDTAAKMVFASAMFGYLSPVTPNSDWRRNNGWHEMNKETGNLKLSVAGMASKEGKAYIKNNHYSGGCHNGPMCWGLYDGDVLVGVCAFATPCSENVRRSIFGGDENKHRVTELHRLHTQDYLPKNTTSWFVARAIKGLVEYRPEIRAILSFADSTEGHTGTIYRALNFDYKGTGSQRWFYRDQNGILRHPRQNGVNISKKYAKGMGWVRERRNSKIKYLLIVANTKSEKRFWRKRVLI